MTDRERGRGRDACRRIGEGLAGAVLRNILLDMQERNVAERVRLRGSGRRSPTLTSRGLRDRPVGTSAAESPHDVQGRVLVAPFREEYHSYIQIEVVKGTVDGFKLKRHAGYKNRDLMVEGSGFLQWLSVFALATDPELNVLLLDEPDAHLHSSLQEQLSTACAIAAVTGKQSSSRRTPRRSCATPSPRTPPHPQRRPGRPILVEESQKVGLLAGLGSDYAPRVDRAKRTKRVLFVEGRTDLQILKPSPSGSASRGR